MRIPDENLSGATGAVEVRLMGRFAALRDGREVVAAAFGGRKVRLLIRILAVRSGAFVPNDVLADTLWPERPPANPTANLQVLVNRARRAVGRADLILTGPGGYALAGPPECTVDTEEFLAAVAAADRLAGASALAAYRNALIGAAEPLVEDMYADWARPYRSRVLQARQSAWEQGATLAIDLGDPGLAVTYATAAVEAEPLREAAALTLMRALAAAGDRAAALARFDRYRRTIADELGLDPAAAVLDFHRSLLRPEPSTADLPTRPSTVVPAGGVAAGAGGVFGELRFVGRDEVLGQVLTGLPTGVVQLAGRSGSGKSRLLEAIAATLPAIRVAAYWAERDEPWSLARTLLRGVLTADPTGLAALPPRLRYALGNLLPELDEPVLAFDPETRNALVVEATRRLLPHAAGRTVMLDDLQWADPSSVRLVAGFAGRAQGPRLIVAYRPDELTDNTAELLCRLTGPPAIALGGLLEASLAELVHDPDIVAAIVAATDRSPMAVTEVLRALHTERLIELDRDGRWRARSPEVARRARQVGQAGQRRAIADRAAAHPGPAATVLRLLALLGREAPARTIGAAAELPEAQVLAALDQLAAADLARLSDHGWRAAHDMVAEVVIAGLTDGARARLHGQLAAVLDQHGGDPAEQAHHWLGAGDPARAAEAYARAAENALDHLADTEAEQLVDTALAAGSPPGPVLARLLEARAQARRRRGDIAAARSDLRAALGGQSAGAGRARILAQLATLDSGADDLRRAAGLAELALVEAGPLDPARAQALEVASIIDMNLGLPDRADARATEALAIFTRTGDSRGIARIVDARAMAAFLHGSIEAGVAELDRAAHLFESSGDLMRTVTPRSTCGHGRVLLDQPADGLLDTEHALDIALTLGHPEGVAYALWHRSEALSALGRGEDALADGQAALAAARRLGHRGWTATAWRAIGIAYQGIGDLEAALDAFGQSLHWSVNLDLFGCWAAARAALVCVDLGHLDEAEELVGRASDGGPALGRHEARWAAAAFAVARADPDAPALIRHAIAAATAAGARIYLPRLGDLERQSVRR